MATHSSTLAWKIPWMEEPGRLQSMGSLRVGQDWVTSLSLFTFMHWRRKWQLLQRSCLENPRDGGAWWAAVCGVTQSQTRLKWLSSSSSSSRSKSSWIFIIYNHVNHRTEFLINSIRINRVFANLCKQEIFVTLKHAQLYGWKLLSLRHACI